MNGAATYCIRTGKFLSPACEVSMPERSMLDEFDFSPVGAALKRAREARGISRETLAEMCGISSGYIKTIENAGKHPGFQVFWKLVTMFNISVDEYFYPDRVPKTDSRRRGIISKVHEIETRDVYLLEDIVKGMARRKDSGAEDDAEDEAGDEE
jgi:transcriptional regulator with XRE-family HTH domain